ncbi:MAG: pseudouridine synthase [Pseudobdellovibrio sp.]
MQLQGSPDQVKTISHSFADDFIIFNKRTGMRTHKVNENQLGLVETLSDKLATKLYVVHRLDKETSGLIMFAKTQDVASDFAKKFESHEISKTYYFLTDHESQSTRFNVKTHIEKNDKTYINNPSKPTNSETHFIFVKKINDKINLWKAHPLTGKPHQIRLHAEKACIPILGDHEHGGSPWFRLALHAGGLNFTYKDQKVNIQIPLPFCFENEIHFLGDFLENEYQDLSQILNLDQKQTYRLYHRSHQIEDIRIDLYGDVVWVYWYKEEAPSQDDLLSVEKFCKNHHYKYVIRHMINRGQGVGGKEQQDLYYNENTLSPLHVSENWIAYENNFKVQLRRDQGFSPGLFLDQRANRSLINSLSKDKNVLNLFSYTSLFSVAAALGKAKQVTTVDASPNFLNWSRENFKINNLDDQKYEFFAQDSLLFLKGSVKRDRKWDIIICDPPSFGRTKNTTWKIEKDLPELIDLMWKCLNKNGLILFTCNYEKWTLLDLEKVFNKVLMQKQASLKNLPLADLDFEFLDAYDNLLKGLIIKKG